MKKRIIIGIFLILAGAIILLNSFSGITGLTILENLPKQTGYFLGVVFVIAGILLLNSAKRGVYGELSDIVDEFNHERINPVKAAIQTRNALRTTGREINGVKYKGSEKSVTVTTPQGAYSLRANNREHAAELALGVYEVAIANDPKNSVNCEVHLSEHASTKHHRQGFLEEEQRFKDKYSSDISSL